MKYYIFLLLLISISCTNNPFAKEENNNFISAKKELLICNTTWNNRTENEKVIGYWEALPEKMKGSGNSRTVSGEMVDLLVFFTDTTFSFASYHQIGFSKTDPLSFGIQKYNIENGILTFYNADKKAISRPIYVTQNQIEYQNKVYHKAVFNQ